MDHEEDRPVYSAKEVDEIIQEATVREAALQAEVEQLRAQVVELCDLFGEIDSWIGMPVEWRDRASRVLKAGRDAAKEADRG